MSFCFIFFFNATPTTEIYTLSLHDALPISKSDFASRWKIRPTSCSIRIPTCEHEVRSEEHTSELQSRFDLVCRLLLEKKNESRDQSTVYAVARLCIDSRIRRLRHRHLATTR